MNGLDLLIVFFTAFYAFSVGRSVILWTFLSVFYGLWIPLLLLVMPVKARKAFTFPQWFVKWLGPKYVNRTINKMEQQF